MIPKHLPIRPKIAGVSAEVFARAGAQFFFISAPATTVMEDMHVISNSLQIWGKNYFMRYQYRYLPIFLLWQLHCQRFWLCQHIKESKRLRHCRDMMSEPFAGAKFLFGARAKNLEYLHWLRPKIRPVLNNIRNGWTFFLVDHYKFFKILFFRQTDDLWKYA